MARKVLAAALGGSLRDKTVAVLGLTFKPNTDDMRDSPSIPLITALQDMGAKVRGYDPDGMEQAREVLNNVTYTESAYDCAQRRDVLVIVTEWEQFRALDFGGAEDRNGEAGDRRSAQHLSARGYGKARVYLYGRRAGLVLKAVMAGHSRSKNGVASLAY